MALSLILAQNSWACGPLVQNLEAAENLVHDLKFEYCGEKVAAKLWQYTEDTSLRGVIDEDDTLRKAINPNEASSAAVAVQKLTIAYVHQEMDAYSICSSSRGSLTIDCR